MHRRLARRLAAALVAALLASPVPTVQAANIPSYAGLHLVIHDRTGMCGDSAKVGKYYHRCSHWSPSRPYEDQTCVGNMTIPEDLDDTWWHSKVMDTRNNNEWKPNFFVFNISGDPEERKARGDLAGSCSSWRHGVGEIGWRRRFNTSWEGPCLIKAGTYQLNGIHKVDATRHVKPESVMPYGTYRFRNRWGKGSRMLLCYFYEVRFIPRPGVDGDE